MRCLRLWRVPVAERNRSGGCGLFVYECKQTVIDIPTRKAVRQQFAVPKSQAQTRFVVVMERATRHYMLTVFGRPHAHFSLVEVG
jgi:hypothetical protein